jgi:anhydro-N-acetylmuramic acid kinase
MLVSAVPAENSLPSLYIGLLSGTSMDAIDATAVAFTPKPTLVASVSGYYPPALKKQVAQLIVTENVDPKVINQLDVELGHLFADVVQELLNKANLSACDIVAIGSHGQTIYHRPHAPNPYSLQIGSAQVIADRTQITTIADFRTADIKAGGQGAPLAPLFHREFMHSSTKHRAIVNIGGIANVTLLPKDNSFILGFDTGPGNGLLDAWIAELRHEDYDKNGAWAATGVIDPMLLDRLLADPFFALPPPKSTGKDYFNLAWLESLLTNQAPENVQATLVELTARTIMKAILRQKWSDCEVLICGGGIHNHFLVDRMATYAHHYPIVSTEQIGIAPDWLEAMLFAWLAKLHVENISVDTCAITGAKYPTLLGTRFKPNQL